MRKLYSILLVTLGYASFAQTLLIEDFDYTAGSALTDNGWGAHSAAGTNPVLVIEPGLQFEDYYGSGNGNAAGVNNTGQDVNKTFTEVSVGSVYASFLVNATASVTDDYFFLIGASPITSAFRGRLFIQPDADPSKFTFGFSFNQSSAQQNATTLYNFGQTYLVVVKYTIIDGDDNDTVSLYVFAEGDSFETEPSTALIGPLTGSASDLNPGTVALRQFSNDQEITVDGIRVSTIWDVYNGTNGVKNNTISGLKVFPNPVTSGIVNITSNESNTKTVTVYDITGKKVMTAKTNGNTINVNSLTNGVYILNITAGNKTATKKLIINK